MSRGPQRKGDRQPAGNWPWVHRVTRADLTSAFADGWHVDSIEPATIEITTDPDGIRAWSAALRRI